MIEIEVKDKCIENVQSHSIPSSRRLVKFTGTLKEVEKKLGVFRNNLSLKAFGELEIIEPHIDVQLGVKVHQLLSEFKSEEIEILVSKYKVIDQAATIDQLVEEGVSIEELNPIEVLKKKLEYANCRK